MALIKCPECGLDVSNKAEKCIHCGYPLQESIDIFSHSWRCVNCGEMTYSLICSNCGQLSTEELNKLNTPQYAISDATSDYSPIEQTPITYNKDSKGTLVVYGYTGWFLIKPTLKIYLNGEYIGDVSHRAKTREIPITGPTNVEIKCGVRSTAVRLFPDMHNVIYTEFDRTTGSILAELRSY